MPNASRLQQMEILRTVTKLCVGHADEVGEIHLHSEFFFERADEAFVIDSNTIDFNQHCIYLNHFESRFFLN